MAANTQLQINQIQITQASNVFKNIRNAVKILPIFSNWEGHTKLYTEIESNFTVGDTVYITYTEPSIPIGVFSIENPTIPYAEYALGYKVLYVNKAKNELVIDRDYINIASGTTLRNQYLSKISCKSGDYYNGKADGAVFFRCSIYSGLTFTQGVLKYCNLYGIVFNDKYEGIKTVVTTNDFNSKFGVKSPTTTTLQSNNSYYNRIENCNLIDCDVINGMFSGCTITGTTGNNYIDEGYFYNCQISGYTINGGHFYNCVINSNNTWEYGYWDNSRGTGLDFLTDWRDGVWNRGNFGNIWSGGTFSNGVFTGIWYSGTANSGAFAGATWYHGLVRNATFSSSSVWYGGTFNKGVFANSTFSGGTFNGGTMYGSTVNKGTFNGGTVTGCTFYNANIIGSKVGRSTMYGGQIYGTPDSYGLTVPIGSTLAVYGGSIRLSTFSDGDFYNGNLDSSTGNVNLTIYNGYINNCQFTGTTVQNGIFTRCRSQYLKWYYGVYTEGIMYDSTWYDGYWNDGYFSGRTGSATQAHWYDGHFYGGVFWGNVPPPPPTGDNSWHGGYFHYGLKNGVNVLKPGGNTNIIQNWAVPQSFNVA